MGVKICPECNGKVASSRMNCIHCGYEFNNAINIIKCKDCGAELNEGVLECPECGSRDILNSVYQDVPTNVEELYPVNDFASYEEFKERTIDLVILPVEGGKIRMFLTKLNFDAKNSNCEGKESYFILDYTIYCYFDGANEQDNVKKMSIDASFSVRHTRYYGLFDHKVKTTYDDIPHSVYKLVYPRTFLKLENIIYDNSLFRSFEKNKSKFNISIDNNEVKLNLDEKRFYIE